MELPGTEARRREIETRVLRLEMPATDWTQRCIDTTSHRCGCCGEFRLVLVRGRGRVVVMCVQCDVDRRPPRITIGGD